MRPTHYTMQDWLHAWPVLKRCGVEHVGPCPLCGGTDRFRVTPAGAYCRVCLRDGSDTERFRELLHTVFGEPLGAFGDAVMHPRLKTRLATRPSFELTFGATGARRWVR